MQSIQDIFVGEFADAARAVIQKLRPNKHNLEASRLGFTESWPRLDGHVDVMVLSLGKEGARQRRIFAGFITDRQPSNLASGRFRFYVDHFREMGLHDLNAVSDGRFYLQGNGGGARIYARNPVHSDKSPSHSAKQTIDSAIPKGAMERRLVWVRKNHHRFRDPVWKHWESKCAVTDSNCDGLLVASHIHPWSKCTPQEQTDPNNGLLLAAPLDSLFDRGWISFRDTGEMLVHDALSTDTRLIFGVHKQGLCIGRTEKISAQMKCYLQRHRKVYGFD